MASPLIFQQAKALLVEMGASRRLGELVKGMGSKRTLLVTDPGVRGAGLLEESVESLLVAGVHVTVFDKTVPDPSESLVLECAAFARDEGVDSVVGFGGGSSMDIAKLVALLASPTSSQPLGEMFGVGNARGERLPLVQVPTTAGTGSEVTPISIITTGAAEKKGVVSPLLLPDLAVLDGDLTLSLPSAVSAASGIDAMVHAIEAYTSRLHKNPLSDVYAREALRLLSANIVQVCDEFQQPSGALRHARAAMLLGSCYAGMAFANAPVAAVHALAYPLGARFKVPHGLSNSLMLPHVLAYNSEEDAAARCYRELAPLVLPHIGQGFAATGGGESPAAVRYFVQSIASLPQQLGLPTRLSQVGVTAADLEHLAEEAMQQTRLLPNNPREVLLDDARQLYEAAL